MRRHTLFFEDTKYIMPNTDYLILDEAGAVVDSGRSDRAARLDLPEGYRSTWKVICGSLHEVSGRVLLPGGRTPLADETVEVVLWTGRRVSSTTDGEGRLRLESVPEGSLSVRWADHQAVLFVDADVEDAVLLLKAPDTPPEDLGTDVHDALVSLAPTNPDGS